VAGEGERHDGDDDDRGADQGQRAGPLAEDEHRRQHREGGPGAARQRVDHGEVARVVAALERREVRRVQAAAADHEADARRGDALAADHELDRGGQGVERRRADAGQPHERQAAARLLGEEVPRRVGDRG
jgi:hypothetical protein